MRSSNNVYIDRVDILRFMAATLVIFWHYIHFDNVIAYDFVPRFFPFSILTEGHTGVSLFMVLSGFIFQYINAGKEIVFTQFLKNRIFRIFPLAIFWILILVAVDHLNSVEALLNTFFVFDSRSVPGVGWTIVVEFQFYLIFPVFHKVIEKKNGIFNLLGLVMLMIILRSVIFINIENIRDFSYYTIFGRVDQFLLGMIAAKLYTGGSMGSFFSPSRYSKPRMFLLAGVVLSLLAFFYLFNLSGGFMGSISTHARSAIWVIFHDVEALFYASVIVLFISLNRYSFIAPVETALAKFGEFSYSMYWLHVPVIKALCVLMRRFHLFWPGSFEAVLLSGFLIILPAIVIVSALSYYFFEKPFLQFRQNYRS